MLPITPETLLFAVLIFVLRVINYAVSTLRLVSIARNWRLMAAGLAFLEALLFAVVMTRVVTDLENSLINLFAYCIGASVGSYVGMMLEGRFITSYSVVNVITHHKGQEIAARLRDCGYGATVTHGEGRDGEVIIIHSSISNRSLPHFLHIVRTVEEDVFIQVEPARVISRGWMPRDTRFP
jgi:uncharacterized protein YebE (UPF0316 family)